MGIRSRERYRGYRISVRLNREIELCEKKSNEQGLSVQLLVSVVIIVCVFHSISLLPPILSIMVRNVSDTSKLNVHARPDTRDIALPRTESG